MYYDTRFGLRPLHLDLRGHLSGLAWQLGVEDKLSQLFCKGPVIAVDVTGRMGPFKRAERRGMAHVGRPLRRALTGDESDIPHLGETIVRTVMVGSIDTVAAARLHADLVITPQVEGIGLMDWKTLPRVAELGRQAARAALEAHPDLASRLTV